MRLVEVSRDEADALARGDTGERAIAPGWPHDETVAGLAFARSGGLQFVILDDEGRIAGECGTKTPPRNGIVEIGYGLAAPSRGRGLGGAAVAALVDLLRARPDVVIVEAEIHVSNTASRRLVERLAFLADEPALHGYLRYRLVV